MSPGKVDPAILEALGADASQASLTTSGFGSGFASTSKLTLTIDGEEKEFFVKIASGANAPAMLEGEFHSLKAINDAVPSLCPKPHAHGPLSTGGKYFIATDFIDLGYSASGGSGLSLAQKLAKLHSAPVSSSASSSSEHLYGFPVSTYCGDTPQDNSWKNTWSEFFKVNRLETVHGIIKQRHSPGREFNDTMTKIISSVVDRLIGGVEGGPVVIHGDLWSGNHGRGKIGKDGGAEELIFDPSVVYGHPEYELGIMNMFGGFGKKFWDEYVKLMPKAEPASEWDDRVLLYELYHHLNHYAIFGGGYRGGAMSIMKRLISKYD